MAWRYKSARIQRRTSAQNAPIVAAAVTIYDDALAQQPGESTEEFLARSHRIYPYTRLLTPDGTGFAQTLDEFRAMVKTEVAAHIQQRNAATAMPWEDATGFEV